MKRCHKCNIDKPFNEFYRNRSRHDGYSHWCKDCTKESQAAYNRTDHGKLVRESIRKSARCVNKEQYEAHKAVFTAVRNGTLTRPTMCDICGKHCKPDAHHEDYNKPLDVYWLCRECHAGL